MGALIVGDAPTRRLDAMPYGGVKDSGEGRDGVRYAIDEMTERRLLAWLCSRKRKANLSRSGHFGVTKRSRKSVADCTGSKKRFFVREKIS
ncbi:MAG: aldehyde dehydrogenase family protein [Acidobacteriaceae bacterium]